MKESLSREPPNIASRRRSKQGYELRRRRLRKRISLSLRRLSRTCHQTPLRQSSFEKKKSLLKRPRPNVRRSGRSESRSLRNARTSTLTF